MAFIKSFAKWNLEYHSLAQYESNHSFPFAVGVLHFL